MNSTCDLVDQSSPNEAFELYFEEQCGGQKSCNITVDTAWWSQTECLDPGVELIVVTYCAEKPVQVWTLELSRPKISVLVIALDLAVCLGFMIYTHTL